MQDSSLYSQIKTQIQHPQSQFPEQEHLKCPRCDSTNTKFCYYNNYNLSQPRHFCKNCRRYWTKGGALRNIPVGGGSRKNSKRSSSSSSSSSSTATSAAAKRSAPAVSEYHNESKNVSNEMAEALSPKGKGGNFGGQFGNFMEMSGSFSSLLDSSGSQFGGLLDGLGPNGPSLQMGGHFGDPGSGSGQNVDPEMGLGCGNSNNSDGFLNIEGGGESGSWDGSSNGWPDLAIYTPGPNFQ